MWVISRGMNSFLHNRFVRVIFSKIIKKEFDYFVLETIQIKPVKRNLNERFRINHLSNYDQLESGHQTTCTFCLISF